MLEQDYETFVPACIRWSQQDVANWIIQLGFPHYSVSDTDFFISLILSFYQADNTALPITVMKYIFQHQT